MCQQLIAYTAQNEYNRPNITPERSVQLADYPIIETRSSAVEYNLISPHIVRVSHPDRMEATPVSATEKCLVLYGPPGCGKDTFMDKLLTLSSTFERVMTTTTRPRRTSEETFDPYIRATEEEFLSARDRGMFMEVDFHGFWYGSPKSEVARIRDNHKIPILRIDPNGAHSIRALASVGADPFENVETVYAYIVPPRGAEIYQRLMKRTLSDNGGDYMEARAKTQARVRDFVVPDLTHMNTANYILINEAGKLDEVASEFLHILNIPREDTIKVA